MIIVNHNKPDFKQATISYLRDFILSNNVTENDSISLNQHTFDELALDYRHTYGEPLTTPFIFLNVWIKIAPTAYPFSSYATITRNDPKPDPEPLKETISEAKVYRCGYCGKLIDEFGYDLRGGIYEMALKRWKAHGDYIFVAAVGKCCEHKEKNKSV